MRRGTTPVLTVGVNADLTGQTIFVTIRQNPDLLIEKTGKDLTVTTDTVKVTLTQKETLLVRSGDAELQLRCVDKQGNADASEIVPLKVERLLKDGIIEYVDS